MCRPNISVVIPWCDRVQLSDTLKAGKLVFDRDRDEILVLNCGGDLSVVTEIVRASELTNVHLLHIDGVNAFNKAMCLNIGIDAASNDIVIVLDADVLLERCFVQQSSLLVSQGKCFVFLKRVTEQVPAVQQELAPSGQIARQTSIEELELLDGRSASVEYSIDSCAARTGNGIVVFSREHFYLIEGYDSQMQGWGYEDLDFQIRLQLGAGSNRFAAGSGIHVSHPRVVGAERSDAANRAHAWDRYAKGCFTGTLREDLARWSSSTTRIDI